MKEQALREVGIDYDAGLRRFVGKRELYEKYLGQFVEDTHAGDAKKALEAQNYPEVLEQVHALKGLAGTLGFSSLYDISAEMVRNLRADHMDSLEEQMKQLLGERDRLIAAIQQAGD